MEAAQLVLPSGADRLQTAEDSLLIATRVPDTSTRQTLRELSRTASFVRAFPKALFEQLSSHSSDLEPLDLAAFTARFSPIVSPTSQAQSSNVLQVSQARLQGHASWRRTCRSFSGWTAPSPRHLLGAQLWGGPWRSNRTSRVLRLTFVRTETGSATSGVPLDFPRGNARHHLPRNPTPQSTNDDVPSHLRPSATWTIAAATALRQPKICGLQWYRLALKHVASPRSASTRTSGQGHTDTRDATSRRRGRYPCRRPTPTPRTPTTTPRMTLAQSSPTVILL